jgi:hypothetical protein
LTMISTKTVTQSMCEYVNQVEVQKSIVKLKKLSAIVSLNHPRAVNRDGAFASPLSKRGLILPRIRTTGGRLNPSGKPNESKQSKTACVAKLNGVSPRQWEMFRHPPLSPLSLQRLKHRRL